MTFFAAPSGGRIAKSILYSPALSSPSKRTKIFDLKVSCCVRNKSSHEVSFVWQS
jgi:hypothetical protein